MRLTICGALLNRECLSQPKESKPATLKMDRWFSGVLNNTPSHWHSRNVFRCAKEKPGTAFIFYSTRASPSLIKCFTDCLLSLPTQQINMRVSPAIHRGFWLPPPGGRRGEEAGEETLPRFSPFSPPASQEGEIRPSPPLLPLRGKTSSPEEEITSPPRGNSSPRIGVKSSPRSGLQSPP